MSNNSLNLHKSFLRNIIRDDRLQPSRRLLAELILLYIEDYIPLDLIENIYTKNRVNFQTREGSAEEVQRDKLNLDAKETLKNIFKSLGGDDGSTESRGVPATNSSTTS